MSKELIVAIISAVATVVAATLPLYIQNRKLRRETKFIATGLAVAYYYSFITRLFDLIDDRSSALVLTDERDKQVEPLKLRGAKLTIRFPADLDESSLKETSSIIRTSSKRGEIRRGNEKPMQVNFTTSPTGDDVDVVIVADFPTILDAASKHYSGMNRNPDFSTSAIWKETSERELGEFRAKIRKMVDETRLKGRVELIQEQ